jgi:hypothetical protein
MILIILGELYLLFFSRGDEENISRRKKKKCRGGVRKKYSCPWYDSFTRIGRGIRITGDALSSDVLTQLGVVGSRRLASVSHDGANCQLD